VQGERTDGDMMGNKTSEHRARVRLPKKVSRALL